MAKKKSTKKAVSVSTGKADDKAPVGSAATAEKPAGAGKGKKFCPFCSKVIGAANSTCPECGKAIPPKIKKMGSGKRGRPAGAAHKGASFAYGANASGNGSNPFDAALSFIEAAGGLEAAKETIDRLAALGK